MDFDEVLHYVKTEYRELEWASRVEMIAELSYLNIAERSKDKVYLLWLQQMFRFVSDNSNTFSFDSHTKIQKIQDLLL
jgi:hypothetical protein